MSIYEDGEQFNVPTKWLADHDKQIRDEVIEQCMDVVPFRIDDGDYSDGFNACSKKILDRLAQMKGEQNEKHNC